MKKPLLWIAGLCLLALSASASAQFVNGEFESGPVGWSWRQLPSRTDCNEILPGFNATLTDTPANKMGSDRAAAMTVPYANFGGGTTIGCREIEQVVTVPVGMQLEFDFQLDMGGASPKNPGGINVIVEDVATGLRETTSWDVAGGTFNYGKFTVDLARFWGRSVYIRIQAESVWTLNQKGHVLAWPTPIYIDTVKLAAASTYSEPPDDGGWYNPDRSGQGLHISTAPDGQLTMTWYTFDTNGKAIWYMTDIAPYANKEYRSPLYKFTWNTANNTRNPGQVVGDVMIRTASPDEEILHFYFDFHANGDSTGWDGTERMVFLSGDEGYTGLWFEPLLSGWGFSVDHENNESAAVTLFYYDGSEPVWAYGVVANNPVNGVVTPLVRYTATGLCPQCQWQPVTRTGTAVGQIGLRLNTNQAWFNATGTQSNWARGTAAQPAALGRLTYPDVD